MEEAIRTRLLSTVALDGVPVNWGAHPQGAALPGIVLTVVSAAEGLTLKGPDGLSQGRVQVDCYAATYGAARATARAVIAALYGWRSGQMRLVEHVATRDSREGGSNEADRPYRTSLDFMTHWRAA